MRYNTSPSDRLPPGSSANFPRGLNDAVLRGEIGHITGNIRLTPFAASLAGAAAYNFGAVNRAACGTYRLEWQASSVIDTTTAQTGIPLGAINRVEITLYENTAGVFLAKINRVGDLDGGPAADAQGGMVNDAADEFVVSGTSTDHTAVIPTAGDIFIGVLTTAAIATADDADGTGIANGALVAVGGQNLRVGDLYLHDASTNATRIYRLTRLS